MDLPTTVEWMQGVTAVGGAIGGVAGTKMLVSSAARWWADRQAERRAKAEAALTGEKIDLVNAQTLAAAVEDLQARVRVLEKALQSEREARERAERERDEERTGKHEAMRQATAATARLELVERDADRRIREALNAVAKSAEERARWERIAHQTKAAFDAYEAEVRAGYTNRPPESDRDRIDTEPPPKPKEYPSYDP